LIDIYQNGFTT